RRPRPGAGHLGAERRRHPARPPLDAAAALLQELGEPGGRLLLLVAELRVGVDAERQIPELLGGVLHRLDGPCLQAVDVGHASSRVWGYTVGTPLTLTRPRDRCHPRSASWRPAGIRSGSRRLPEP